MPPIDQTPGFQGPDLQPEAPTPAPAAPNKPHRVMGRSWNRLSHRANIAASITALFVFLVAIGGAIGYFYAVSKHQSTTASGPKVQSLSQSDLQKLGQIGSNLGTNNQVLNIQADALFRGQADVVGNLTVGGKLDATGTTTLKQLDVTGALTTAALNVTGATTFQNALTVTGLATFGSLTVSGATNLATINANNITVRQIAINGPLTVGHLVTQGAAPSIAAGADGTGGTVSISGNDTTGQVNVNTGAGPGTTLATITFKAAYGASVHIQLTPLTASAASAQAFVTRSATGFVIHANTTPVGSTLSFDYLVTQ